MQQQQQQQEQQQHDQLQQPAAGGQHAFIAAGPQHPTSLGSLLGGAADTPFGPAVPLGGPGGSGWVWAAAMLLAARMGRQAAQEARLDVRQLQVRAAVPWGGLPSLGWLCKL